jgi:hypothetical protein
MIGMMPVTTLGNWLRQTPGGDFDPDACCCAMSKWANAL